MSLVTAQGVPTAAKAIKDRLVEIHPQLGLCLMPWPDPPFERWAVTYWWDDSDPRRAGVRDGSLAPDRAFDILLILPEDCPPDQAYGYLVNSLKAWSGSRADIAKLLDRVHHYNAKARQAAVQETVDLAEELLTANAKTLFREEKGHIPSTRRPDRKAQAADRKRVEEYLRDA